MSLDGHGIGASLLLEGTKGLPGQELGDTPGDDGTAFSCRHAFRPDRSGPPAQYTQFADLNGRRVAVTYSTLAGTAAVWIYTGLAESQQAMVEAAGLPTQLAGGSAHLCRAMAREIRDALTAFLDDPVAPEMACETCVPTDSSCWAPRKRTSGELSDLMASVRDKTRDVTGVDEAIRRMRE